jgi:hypothetical protein
MVRTDNQARTAQVTVFSRPNPELGSAQHEIASCPAPAPGAQLPSNNSKLKDHDEA